MPDFPPGVEAELELASAITPPEGIRDLRGLLWSSIDSEDARDLDQIEYAEEDGRSATRLFVGIADVASRVRRGGVIDQRAAHNTVSIYTAGKIFHLLPEALSAGYTSLAGERDRLAMVVEMTVTKDGQMLDPSVYPAWVRNHARLSYETASEWCERKPGEAWNCQIPGLDRQLELQLAAADRLRALRFELGALTLSSYEARPVTRGGQVVDLQLISPSRAREMVASFMIAANAAAAGFLKARGWPILERVVRAPRNWARIQQIAAEHGVRLPDTPAPKPLAGFLAQYQASAGRNAFRELSFMVVKLLGPGEYCVETPEGPQTSHFGLALDDYSHSTAPHRRYADQVLQRMLLACAAGAANPFSEAGLRQIARHCTEREDAARKVERLMRKVAAGFLLRGRIGEVFPATVTGASAKGTYVRLKSPPAEGRVIRGERSLLVGDRVHVRLLSIDEEQGFIDFERT